MKTKFIIIGLAAVFAAGCKNPGVVQVSPNTYMLAREDHGGIFGIQSALKAGVIRDANAFAEKQGKVAVPISAKEHGVGILADWAKSELTFKVVDKNDPEAHGTNILTSSSLEGGPGLAQSRWQGGRLSCEGSAVGRAWRSESHRWPAVD